MIVVVMLKIEIVVKEIFLRTALIPSRSYNYDLADIGNTC